MRVGGLPQVVDPFRYSAGCCRRFAWMASHVAAQQEVRITACRFDEEDES